MESFMEIEFKNDFKVELTSLNESKIIIKISLSNSEQPMSYTDIKNLSLNGHTINIIPGEIK